MKARVVVFRGVDDGEEASRSVGVLDAVAREYGHSFTFESQSLRSPDLSASGRSADAALAGSHLEDAPALVKLRQTLGLYARVLSLPTTRGASDDADLLIVSEEDSARAMDDASLQRLRRVACRLARQRWSLVTCVRHFGEPIPVAADVADFTGVRVAEQVLDLASQAQPSSLLRYDVLVGSAPTAQWVLEQAARHGLQCQAAAWLGDEPFALFAPVEAPAASERAAAGAILAAAMLLRYGLGLGREAAAIEGALASAVTDPQFGSRTRHRLTETVRAFLSGGHAYSQAI